MYENQDGKELTPAKGMMSLSPRKKSAVQGLCGTSSATEEVVAVAGECKTAEEDEKMEN